MVQLPVEIWTCIIEILWANGSRFGSSRKSLVQLCSVNHLLNQVATPFLYRWCWLDRSTSTQSFLGTLLSNLPLATSVRHLRISVAFKRAQLEETIPLLAKALETTSQLTSLTLRAWAWSLRANPEPLDLQRSIHLNDTVFTNPARLPFRLRLFSTNLPCTPSLSEFITSQPNIYSIHWRNPVIVDGHTPVFPTNVVSQAFTHFPNWASLVKYVPIFLENAPSVCRILIDTEISEMDWFESLESGTLQSMPILSKLDGLALLGHPKHNAWLHQLFDSIVPSLSSLTHLRFCFHKMPSHNYLMNTCEYLNDITNLKTFIYDAKCFIKWLNPWLASSPDFPLGVEVYTSVVEGNEWDDDPPTYQVCFGYNNQRSWSYKRLPHQEHYHTLPGAQYDWYKLPSPEKTIEVAFGVYWN